MISVNVTPDLWFSRPDLRGRMLESLLDLEIMASRNGVSAFVPEGTDPTFVKVKALAAMAYATVDHV